MKFSLEYVPSVQTRHSGPSTTLPLSQTRQSDGAWKSLSTNVPGEHSLQVDAPWAATFPMVQGLQKAEFASETVPAEHASQPLAFDAP